MKRILILAALALGACGDDDGTMMGDAGVVPDSSAADAETTPDTGTTSDEVERYLTLERLDTQQFCECAVESGDFADVDACFAADPDAISTAEEVACLRAGIASASEADQAVFECRNDASRAQADCRGALSCEDYSASPTSAARIACDDTANEAFDACGAASNDEAIGECFD